MRWIALLSLAICAAESCAAAGIGTLSGWPDRSRESLTEVVGTTAGAVNAGFPAFTPNDHGDYGAFLRATVQETAPESATTALSVIPLVWAAVRLLSAGGSRKPLPRQLG